MKLLRPFSLLAFTLLSALLAKGQVISANYILQNTSPVFINHQVQYFTSNTFLDLEAIRATPDSVYKNLKDQDVIFHGYDPYYYAFRLVIENSDTIAHTLILLPGGLGIRSASLWQGKNDSWKLVGTTGYNFPFNHRSHPYIHHAFTVAIPPYTRDTFYLSKDETHAYKLFAFILSNPSAVLKAEHRIYGFFGFLTGILLLFGLFNIYLYFSLREKIHIWYSLYIFLITAYLLKHDGIDAEFLGMDSALAYRLTPMGGIGSLAIGTLVQVIRIFLQPAIAGSMYNKILNFLKWFTWITGVCSFITFYIEPAFIMEKWVVRISGASILVSIIFSITCAIYSLIKGFKPSIFILAGLSVFFAGGIARTLFISTKSIVFPPTLFHFGLLVEVIIISFGLMYRYNRYKREKEELHQKLENQKLEAGRNILKTLEEEQKRFARDLHDELGGNLAAIKMTLQSFNLAGDQSALLTSLVDKASVSARNISHNLMPPGFEETPLSVILNNYFRRINAEGSLHIHYITTQEHSGFSKQEDLMIYRMIMELTSNIRKHAHATEATIQLIHHDTRLEIMIEDNGIGISKESTEGMGLNNIRSRVHYLNGSISIDTGNKGTTIIILIPYKKYDE